MENEKQMNCLESKQATSDKSKWLIDANLFIKRFENAIEKTKGIPGELGNILRGLYEECIEAIKEQPTVDAVEVVRCKDCVKSTKSKTRLNIYWCNKFGNVMDSDGYCSCGERKTDEICKEG